MTVLTWVCCSMISAIQMAYGSPVRRQGRSRACCRNQPNNGRTSERAFGPRARRVSLFALRFLCTVAECTTTPYDDSTFVKPLTSYTCTLGEPEAAALQKYLREHGYEFRDVPYARFAA